MGSGGHGGHRPGAGRRPELRGKVALSVTLDAAAARKLRDLADALGVSQSAVLRHLLMQAPKPKR